MKPIEYKDFDGHLILFCKQHYGKTDNLIEKLKMIWAIRCGYEYKEKDNSMITNIMDGLYHILEPTIIDKSHFQQMLHNHITSHLYKEIPAPHNIIVFYAGEIAHMQIKEKTEGKYYKTLVKLPKPQKRIFKRILEGKGKYEDYWTICKIPNKILTK
jgi:hypothetical protein